MRRSGALLTMCGALLAILGSAGISSAAVLVPGPPHAGPPSPVIPVSPGGAPAGCQLSRVVTVTVDPVVPGSAVTTHVPAVTCPVGSGVQVTTYAKVRTNDSAPQYLLGPTHLEATPAWDAVFPCGGLRPVRNWQGVVLIVWTKGSTRTVSHEYSAGTVTCQ